MRIARIVNILFWVGMLLMLDFAGTTLYYTKVDVVMEGLRSRFIQSAATGYTVDILIEKSRYLGDRNVCPIWGGWHVSHDASSYLVEINEMYLWSPVFCEEG